MSITPSSKTDRKKLKTMLTECTYCMQRADDEKESIKDIIEEIHTQFEVPKKIARKVATTMYKTNYEDVQSENEDFEILYENLVTPQSEEDEESSE